ncbi:MAG: hypothetical protein ABIU96_01610 [Rhodanobacter sp.]
MYVQLSPAPGVQHGATLVPDMIVQHVDAQVVERIKALARHRQCSVNDVLLQALRSGLGMAGAQQHSENLVDSHELRVLDGHWEAAERGVFQEALQALADTSPTQLAPESIRYKGPDPDAE